MHRDTPALFASGRARPDEGGWAAGALPGFRTELLLNRVSPYVAFVEADEDMVGWFVYQAISVGRYAPLLAYRSDLRAVHIRSAVDRNRPTLTA